MIKDFYYADGGSIALGNDNFIAQYNNGIGDGKYNITIYTKQDWENNIRLNDDNLIFIDSFRGNNINIYKSDSNKNIGIITTLQQGRYALYKDNNGNIYIEYWGTLLD